VIKKVRWQADKPIEIAWPRFYKRAVADTVDQIKGADRWIAQFPQRIFTDAPCTQRLPIDLPSNGTKRVHGVVVARGAFSACQDYTKDDRGSFMILPHLKGKIMSIFPLLTSCPSQLGTRIPTGCLHIFYDESIQRVRTA
jgi:hypothetical protein